MEKNYIKMCKKCGCDKYEKGRAHDSRRAYRCISCKNVWTEGLQGKQKRFSIQRIGYQFKD